MMQNQDRRRINPPAGGTRPPIFVSSSKEPHQHPSKRIRRIRKPDEHRKIFLRTGIVPSASGSAYFETSPSSPSQPKESFTQSYGSLKLSCTVHGPRPLPRNSAYSPNLLLSTSVKFAPFATSRRRGWVRDAGERDLGVHLETALRGVVLGERFPKSGVEVVVTVLEAEDDGDGGGGGSGVGMMGVLAGCVTVASAALVDAGIDCLDLVSGGVAALVGSGSSKVGGRGEVVLDPSASEHSGLQSQRNKGDGGGGEGQQDGEIRAACVVAYLQSRDEITEVWMRGDAGEQGEELVDAAVQAAKMVRTVLVEAVKEGVELKMKRAEGATGVKAANGEVRDEDGGVRLDDADRHVKVKMKGTGRGGDVAMTG